MCEDYAFDTPAGVKDFHQVFVRIGSRGCTIVETRVVHLFIPRITQP